MPFKVADVLLRDRYMQRAAQPDAMAGLAPFTSHSAMPVGGGCNNGSQKIRVPTRGTGATAILSSRWTSVLSPIGCYKDISRAIQIRLLLFLVILLPLVLSERLSSAAGPPSSYKPSEPRQEAY